VKYFMNLISRTQIGVREMCKSKFKLSSLFLVAMFISGTSFAEPNLANGKTIFTEGKGDNVQPCQTCHGENAQGNDAMGAPRLANIGYGYIIKQLTDFSQDKRTPSGLGAVMNGFAKGLSEQERRDVAGYVNSLQTSPELSDVKAILDENKDENGNSRVVETEKGMEIVNVGKMISPDNWIPACSSCHQYNGRGVDPVFPKIGQQKYVYLVNQLHNWRASEADIGNGAIARENDPAGMMRAVAKKLSDDDIFNVAAFLSSAPPTRGGGDTVPDNNTMMESGSKK
jgi:cytochrome c553